jgi:alkaline phosphatase D
MVSYGRALTTNSRDKLSRRAWLALAASAPAQAALARVRAAPAVITRDQVRPQLAQGIQIGDVLGDRAMIWSRSDRPARMFVEWSLDPHFRKRERVRGPDALADSDFTARLELAGLPPGEQIFVRVRFDSLLHGHARSEPVTGSFRSAPSGSRKLRFLWSGDTCGQGYGINQDMGGMRIYEAMRSRAPDFFIHSGDTIYADSPIEAEKAIEDGKVWRNIVTEEKSKVAETLAEFRGAYKYNLLDDNLRRFNAEVPQIWQWDDHEVLNNWSNAKSLLDNAAYREKSVPLLVARAARAFHEYAPMRPHEADELERVYRKISYGPLLDVFVLDMRSYRGGNSTNRQPVASHENDFLGTVQLRWLEQSLSASRATWKIIAADMPIGLLVDDGQNAAGQTLFDAIANGNGAALGRELELARLLRFLKQQRVRNVVWLTADVHYCAAHYYDPNRARFSDFDGFWEFVAGPLNAGSFGPTDPDDTFGTQVVFQKAPPHGNYSPLGGYQFFGQVDLDPEARTLNVQLVDLNGVTVFQKTLEPT